MTECYEAALAANTTTLICAFLGFLIGIVLIELASFASSSLSIRRDRKRIDKLMTDTEAEPEKYRTDHKN